MIDYVQKIIDTVNEERLKFMIDESQVEIDLKFLIKHLENKENWIWDHHSTKNLKAYECIIPRDDLGVFAVVNIEEDTTTIEFF